MHSDFESQAHGIITYFNRGTSDVAAAVAAPAAGYRIVVVGYSWVVETAEAGKALSIVDTNTSPVTIGIIPLTTAGSSGSVDCNSPCTAAKALKLDTDGTTGKWCVTINYYIQRT